ncbi:uncharacterized protein [Diadema setosum]|uniref:uncharacterized protein n=1 Tax=Diadema setosum TaxID=31175 RepID=UPI003B3B8113
MTELGVGKDKKSARRRKRRGKRRGKGKKPRQDVQEESLQYSETIQRREDEHTLDDPPGEGQRHEHASSAGGTVKARSNTQIPSTPPVKTSQADTEDESTSLAIKHDLKLANDVEHETFGNSFSTSRLSASLNRTGSSRITNRASSKGRQQLSVSGKNGREADLDDIEIEFKATEGDCEDDDSNHEIQNFRNTRDRSRHRKTSDIRRRRKRHASAKRFDKFSEKGIARQPYFGARSKVGSRSKVIASECRQRASFLMTRSPTDVIPGFDHAMTHRQWIRNQANVSEDAFTPKEQAQIDRNRQCLRLPPIVSRQNIEERVPPPISAVDVKVLANTLSQDRQCVDSRRITFSCNRLPPIHQNKDNVNIPLDKT